MITAKILADSINPSGNRITSFLVTYPRFIHSEIMTHRVFSRNAASSRAIPFKKMVESIEKEPAMPERWPIEQKGMQGGDALSLYAKACCKDVWEAARNDAVLYAKGCDEFELHKSLCNRLLEPWAHITVLITATDFNNFFALRAHPAAMPEFQVLAFRMLDCYLKSIAIPLDWGEWHVPRFTNQPEGLTVESYLKISTARCARLSYLTFDGEYSVEKDIELHDRLAESGHWSPFEHCAQSKRAPQLPSEMSNFDINGQWRGWMQYRKLFKDENKTHADLKAIMAAKPEWITL